MAAGCADADNRSGRACKRLSKPGSAAQHGAFVARCYWPLLGFFGLCSHSQIGVEAPVAAFSEPSVLMSAA
jgi:hypothetical protein